MCCNHHLPSLVSKSSCDCDDADIDKTYRMCCISVGNSPSYKAATLLDMGAHASFVNREVASWIDEHGRTDRQVSNRMRGWHEASGTTVSLAGASKSSPILGSVVFDLIFIDLTIMDIHAQVIDSCIDDSPRPLIRANHLIQKIPLYFDETPRFKPDLSKPVVSVTQGYSDTLCSLSVLRTDHPHVPQERRRPHVEPFAAHHKSHSEGRIAGRYGGRR